MKHILVIIFFLLAINVNSQDKKRTLQECLLYAIESSPRKNKQKEKLQLNMDVERKKRKYQQYKQLYSENLTSKEEYLQAKADYDFAVDGRNLVVECQKQDSIYRGIQITHTSSK